MAAIDTLVAAVEAGLADEERLAGLMRACLDEPKVRSARQRLGEEALGTATVAALYAGYRSVPIGEYDGWHLSVARISEASEHIASPICRSLAFCIEAERPVLFDMFRDETVYPISDLRPEEPIRFLSTRVVHAGEVVRSFEYDRWAAMRGKVEATFLKLETGTERPVTIAFSRKTLRPISVGFADHRHTASHFLATLLLHLLGEEEDIQGNMPVPESRALRRLLATRAGEADAHLLTRWKYVQALGLMDGAAAQDALRAIARGSGSPIGSAARQLLQ